MSFLKQGTEEEKQVRQERGSIQAGTRQVQGAAGHRRGGSQNGEHIQKSGVKSGLERVSTELEPIGRILEWMGTKRESGKH